jgi:hypothetical protein
MDLYTLTYLAGHGEVSTIHSFVETNQFVANAHDQLPGNF